jgi:hypothetical protein
MRYALLIYNRPGSFEGLPPNEQQKVYEQFQALGTTPGIATGMRLKPAEHATTVRMQDDRVLVTDGPFADTKEVLGGVVVLDAKNIDEALDLAKKVPTLRFGSLVEVRPVYENPQN